MDIRQTLRDWAGYLLRGALITAPLALTCYIFYWILRTIDQFLPVGIPGLGAVLTVLLVGFVGFSSSNIIGRGILDSTERLFHRVPLVKLVYSSIKDLINAFVGDKKSFDKPVMVRLSADTTVKVLGFVTRDALLGLGMPDHAAVYVPQSYNFAGSLLLVPKALIEPVDATSREVMTFVVSGGVSGLGLGPPMLPAAAPTSAEEPSP